MTTSFKATAIHSWQRSGFCLALGLLVFLMVVVPAGLSYHATSHDHAGEEDGNCSVCTVASQYAAPAAACLGDDAVPQSLTASDDDPARTASGALIHLSARGPPPASV